MVNKYFIYLIKHSLSEIYETYLRTFVYNTNESNCCRVQA